MKRIVAILCAAALLFSLTACSGSNSDAESEADYSNQTLTGQVTAIDGTKVTLLLGEITEQEMDMQQMGGGEAPSDMEAGNAPGNGETPSDAAGGDMSGDGQTPPEIPSGNAQGEGQGLSEMTGSGNQNQTPPDLPEEGSQGDGETPPDKPDGDNGGMASGDMTMPDGNMTMNTFTAGEETAIIDLDGATIQVESGMETAEGSIDDVAVDSVLVIEVGDDNTVTSVTVKFMGGGDLQSGGGMQGGFGGSGEVTQGTAANTIDSDGEYSDRTYTSEGDDENALRVDGATVTLTGITVDKSAGASSNTEDGDFYGMNAALLATNGATVTIQGATITSSAQNGNGVFSYGSGTTVNISDSIITTTADNSGGIQTTGGGTTNAENLTIETSGSSAAAIRSDRGGGTVKVDGGSYTTNGFNSPAVYSTADITVKNATLTANNSEALVIEGENSIALENCDVSGNMSDTQGTSSDENVHNVMIYQSMSGDADVGTSQFSMTGGSLTSRNGDMIYVTNTHCIILLSGVEIVNEDSEGYLLNVSGNSASHGWGNAGSNGGQVEFTASSQTLTGDIIVDTISTLNMTLSDGSDFTGTINIVENEQDGSAVEDNAVVTIESGCTWTLTGNCTLTSLENDGTINYNGYTITLADGTVLK